MSKELLSAIAIAITFIAFMPYIRSIRIGKTKPHIFSWIIWGTTTFVVFLAQLSDAAGAGAWPIGVSGLITLYVAYLAYVHKSDTSITSVDWAFLIVAMSALPFWYITADPLWAVVILTTVDVLGFGPTVRKAYVRPYEENVLFYTLFVVRNAISIAALEHYSLTTVLFPLVIGLASFGLVLLILLCRWAKREGE
ncbi:hypothetical protein ACFL2V_03220 [Pseudomonadota bacterium]